MPFEIISFQCCVMLLATVVLCAPPTYYGQDVAWLGRLSRRDWLPCRKKRKLESRKSG